MKIKTRAALLVFGILILMASLFLTAFTLFRASEIRRAEAQLSLYHQTLINTLDRYKHLPEVLAKTQFVRSGTQGVGLDTLNQRLSEIAAQTDLEALYLMDRAGLTVAASNYAFPVTFLGKNYGFRPYFEQALQGKQGQFFAIGVTTSRPGFFLSAPVRDHTGSVAGVIALKVDFTSLSQIWADTGEQIFVSNQDDVIVLAADERWRYGALTEISPERRAQIALERQFSNAPLEKLIWVATPPDSAKLAGKNYLHLTRSLTSPEWTLHYLVPEAIVWGNATITLGAVTGAGLFLLVVGLVLRARRVRTALKASQADRRKLKSANIALNREIEDRRAAEKQAELAKAELAQAHKLAALGQLSASVTHELGQPISAMKNYLTAAEIGANEQELKLVSRLSRLVARMEAITRDLRFFSRPTPLEFETFTVKRLWKGTEGLMRPDIDQAKINLSFETPAEDIWLKGNRLRLEQVLVNLIKNAMSAVNESGDKRISVRTTSHDGRAEIRVIDHGPGLAGQAFSQIREPFHTTRASGEGMGLGLAISAAIVKEHGGAISLEPSEIGACFLVSIPQSEGL